MWWWYGSSGDGHRKHITGHITMWWQLWVKRYEKTREKIYFFLWTYLIFIYKSISTFPVFFLFYYIMLYYQHLQVCMMIALLKLQTPASQHHQTTPLLLRYKKNGRNKFEKSCVEIRWQSTHYFPQFWLNDDGAHEQKE